MVRQATYEMTILFSADGEERLVVMDQIKD
jgi:hypothetical protein